MKILLSYKFTSTLTYTNRTIVFTRGRSRKSEETIYVIIYARQRPVPDTCSQDKCNYFLIDFAVGQ